MIKLLFPNVFDDRFYEEKEEYKKYVIQRVYESQKTQETQSSPVPIEPEAILFLLHNIPPLLRSDGIILVVSHGCQLYKFSSLDNYANEDSMKHYKAPLSQ